MGRPERDLCGTPGGVPQHRRRGEDPCPRCVAARRRRQRDAKRYIASVRNPGGQLVDADPARRAIAAAQARGVSGVAIAEAAGVPVATLHNINRRGVETSARWRVEAIVDAAVRLSPETAPAGYRPAEPTRVRVRWLLEAGATWRWIGARLGTSSTQIARLLDPDRERVQQRTADAVVELAELVRAGDVRLPRERDDDRAVACDTDGCGNARWEPHRYCRRCVEGERRRAA